MLGFNPLSDSPISDISLPVITGTIYVVDSNDTADLTAKALVQGDISTTDSNDFAVISGEDRVDGYILATDGQDTADFVASVVISGVINTTDGTDTADFESSVLASGSIDTTDEDDTADIIGETTPAPPSPTIDMHDGFTPEEIKRAKQLDKKIAKLEAKKRQAMLDKRAKRKQAIADLVSPPVVKEQQPKVELQSEVQVGKPPTDLKKVNANLIRLEQQKKQLLRAVELRGQIAQAQMQLAILKAQQEAEQDEEDSILALLL
jgi:hypothetical protein